MRYFLPLLLVLAGCGPATTSTMPTARPAVPTPTVSRPAVGAEAHLWVSDGGNWYLGKDLTWQDAYADALTANDTIGIQELKDHERIFPVASGTRLLVLEQFQDKTKVRILEGPQYGRTAWVAFEHVR